MHAGSEGIAPGLDEDPSIEEQVAAVRKAASAEDQSDLPTHCAPGCKL